MYLPHQTFLSNRFRTILLISWLCVVSGICFVFSGKAYGAPVPTVYEDTSGWPADALSVVQGYCNNNPGQPLSTTIWISDASNQGRTSVTIASGQPLNLAWQIGTYRCGSTWNPPTPNPILGGQYGYFRPTGGRYRVLDSANNAGPWISIPSLSTDIANALTQLPPQASGSNNASRSSWAFPIDTSGFTPGSTLTVEVEVPSKQYAFYPGTPNIFVCIEDNTPTIMNVPPHPLYTGDPNNDVLNICREPRPSLRITVNVAPIRHFDLTPQTPVINGKNSVSFDISNSGDGNSRYDSGGVKTGVTATINIWKNPDPTYTTGRIYNGTVNNIDIGPGSSWSSVLGSMYPVPLPPGLVLGDQICAQIQIQPATGVTDGASDPGSRSANGGQPVCISLIARPYFRVYGGDVIAGRKIANGVNADCTKDVDKSVKGYTKQVGSKWVGAGSQFAVSATGAIEGFMSASMHNDASGGSEVPRPSGGLSFMNSGNGPANPLGFDGSAYIGCAPDYDSYVKNNGGYTPSGGGPATLLSGLPAGNRLYLDGDLTINGNIEDLTTEWDSIADIKPVIVIVKGNINIASNVTRLDGLYVALPKSDDTGVINTCFPMSASCSNNKLTVNGAFVAKTVNLYRTNGDLESATSNELGDSPHIAEVFNFPTSFYLGLKYNVFNPTNPDAVQRKYDTIVGLPPIL